MQNLCIIENIFIVYDFKKGHQKYQKFWRIKRIFAKKSDGKVTCEIFRNPHDEFLPMPLWIGC